MPTEHPSSPARTRALGAILPALRCPLCHQPLALTAQGARCPNTHVFDLAREGYLNLLPGHVIPQNADSPPMLAARAAFLGAGHFQALVDTLAAQARAAFPCPPAPPLIVDLGAGPGYYLARLLERLPGWLGLALDISKHAARRAARAHPGIGSLVADCNEHLPLGDACASLALCVFAPRNPEEFARILAPGGLLLVVTPSPPHLQELIEPIGMISLDPDKDARLAQRLGTHFALVSQHQVETALRPDAADLVNLVSMGPSAFHLSAPEIARRVEALPRPFGVTASFKVTVWRPQAPGEVDKPGDGGAT
jgi:23S rRNA (guanine745-N1)-methyltransferase